MSEVIAVGILLMEMLMILQCLQIAFKKEIKADIYTLGIIVVDISLYMLINLKLIPAIGAVGFYIFLFLYCYFEFKQTLVKTIVRLVVAFTMVGCIEGIVTIVVNLFGSANNSIFVLFLSSLIALFFSYIVKLYIPLVKVRGNGKSNKKLAVFISVYGIALGVLIMDYYLEQRIIKLSAVLILIFLVLIFCYLYKLEEAQNEIEKKNYELEVQRVYGGAYEKLLAEVRRKQHDYKNQLSAIYSMHVTAHSLEELVTRQKEYGDTLFATCKYDSILTCCENPILAGYIYYRCISCEKEGISIDYDIHLGQADCCFAVHEIIEILGILIDNACENFEEVQTKYKRIGLEFQEDREKIILKVSNPAKYVSYSEIDRMFIRGYSSKGENRGLGLARVLELTGKYAAEINVNNVLEYEENWINIILKIAK